LPSGPDPGAARRDPYGQDRIL